MKATKLYTPVAFALIMLCNHLYVFSQKLEFLDANNVKAGIGTGANLFTYRKDTLETFYDTTSRYNLFEVPKGSHKALDYTSALWMTALDPTNTLHGAATTYNEYGADYFDGPIAPSYTYNYDVYYKRVFKVTKQQLLHHYSLIFPTSASNVDSAFVLWPAKGNPFVQAWFGVNITEQLAPFFDADGDGLYDPTKGDHPEFCGDQAIFFVFNDARHPHTQTDCPNLGMEVRGLAEEFTSSNPSGKSAVDNTAFIHYEIENKSGIVYHNFNLGKYEDVDVGCFNNDRVGCDTLRNLMFAYNGTFPDPDCQNEFGYGDSNVAFGIKFLNDTLSAFFYGAIGYGGGMSDPIMDTACNKRQNYLTGFWPDGTPFTYGGNGYGGTAPVKYIFSGDPNNPNEWSEATVNSLVPGDRRMVGATGPLNFGTGEVKHFDLAYFTAYDTSGTFLTIVDTLKRDADLIQQFYNSQLVNCQQLLSAMSLNAMQTQINIYPVPAKGLIKVTCNQQIHDVELFDIAGRNVLQQTINAPAVDINLPSISAGVYLLKVSVDGTSVVKKVVIE